MKYTFPVVYPLLHELLAGSHIRLAVAPRVDFRRALSGRAPDWVCHRRTSP